MFSAKRPLKPPRSKPAEVRKAMPSDVRMANKASERRRIATTVEHVTYGISM